MDIVSPFPEIIQVIYSFHELAVTIPRSNIPISNPSQLELFPVASKTNSTDSIRLDHSPHFIDLPNT